jgi:hypothetical protein
LNSRITFLFLERWGQVKYFLTFSHLYFLPTWYFLLNFKIKVLPILRNLKQPNLHIYFFVLVSCTGPVIEKYIMQCCAFFSVKWARLSLLRSAHEGRVHSILEFQFWHFNKSKFNTFFGTFSISFFPWSKVSCLC